jgi:hypothetical protein
MHNGERILDGKCSTQEYKKVNNMEVNKKNSKHEEKENGRSFHKKETKGNNIKSIHKNYVTPGDSHF